MRKKIIENPQGNGVPVETAPLEDRELLAEIARSLVRRPDQVRVEEKRQGNTTVLLLDVADKDKGKIIGRRGRTISSIRKLFTAIGIMDGRNLVVKLRDDD